MTRPHDFAADLAKAGKGFKEIKELVDSVYGIKGLKKTAIYDIIKKVKAGNNTDDQRRFNAKNTKRTAEKIEEISASIESNRRISIQELTSACGLSYGSVSNVIHKDLGLVKKSARWVPRLLSEEQKMERTRCSELVINMVQKGSLGILDKIVTMDESAVSFHTPESKKNSKQWIEKGAPGPLKARVQASRCKQMVLAFFDNKGVIYTNYVPKGTKVNSAYIINAMPTFLKHFKKKRPGMSAGEWFFHWDNAPVHTATDVQEFLGKKGIKMIEHPPYSPDLAPADYFLFPKLKSALEGRRLTQDTFKKEWEGVIRSVSKDDFSAAFNKWIERYQKCIRIGGGYVEK